MYGAKNDECDEITCDCNHDGEAAALCAVRDEGEEKDNKKRKNTTDRGESICLDSIEAEIPGRIEMLALKYWNGFRREYYMMIVGQYVVNGAQHAKTANVEKRCGHLRQ